MTIMPAMLYSIWPKSVESADAAAGDLDRVAAGKLEGQPAATPVSATPMAM